MIEAFEKSRKHKQNAIQPSGFTRKMRCLKLIGQTYDYFTTVLVSQDDVLQTTVISPNTYPIIMNVI